LGENGLGTEGAKALAQSPNMKTLKFLRLNNNHIKDAGISEMAKSKYFTSLENLFLENENWIHSEGAKSLAVSTAFPSLRILVLTLNAIGDEGAFHLAGENNLNTLEQLNVAGNKISPRGEDALRNSPYLQHLKNLELV
jgi:Ran GTPase-activating protein (RanGAP) involved in mRNA processing and transport